jgi:hypothetical protein
LAIQSFAQSVKFDGIYLGRVAKFPISSDVREASKNRIILAHGRNGSCQNSRAAHMMP